VIEIPKLRWTAYNAKRFGVNIPKEVPMTMLQRHLDWYRARGLEAPDITSFRE